MLILLPHRTHPAADLLPLGSRPGPCLSWVLLSAACQLTSLPCCCCPRQPLAEAGATLGLHLQHCCCTGCPGRCGAGPLPRSYARESRKRTAQPLRLQHLCATRGGSDGLGFVRAGGLIRAKERAAHSLFAAAGGPHSVGECCCVRTIIPCCPSHPGCRAAGTTRFY